MNRTSRPIVALMAAYLTHAGCAAARAVPNPAPPASRTAEALVVLLPDDDRRVGGALVSNGAGQTDLHTAFASTRVAGAGAPTPATVMTEAEVRRIFGDALDALPPPSLHFMLFFRFESEELTPESRAEVNQVLETVRKNAAHEVVVVGHTDTTGTPERNFALGMSRAMSVRNVLIATGLDQGLIQVVSHGERDPLVATADGVFEPRNRRVEITVR